MLRVLYILFCLVSIVCCTATFSTAVTVENDGVGGCAVTLICSGPIPDYFTIPAGGSRTIPSGCSAMFGEVKDVRSGVTTYVTVCAGTSVPFSSATSVDVSPRRDCRGARLYRPGAACIMQ